MSSKQDIMADVVEQIRKAGDAASAASERAMCIHTRMGHEWAAVELWRIAKEFEKAASDCEGENE